MVLVRAIIGGNGFGNEFLYLAKAITVSLDLQLGLWLPHWRGAYRDLPSSLNERNIFLYRLKYIRYRLAGYQRLVFDHHLYEKTNEVSISRAVLAYMKSESLDFTSKLILSFPDLEVGIPSVAHRLSYLRSLLMGDRDVATAVYKNIDRVYLRPLRVGIHIRRGDFDQELPLGEKWDENQWNTRIPLEWYENLVQLFQKTYGQRVSFFLTTNGGGSQMSDLIKKYRPITGHVSDARGCDDIVDLLSLSFCDVIISSYSWFSHWAIGFSGGVYFHYSPAPLPAITKPRGILDHTRESVLMPNKLPEKIVNYCNNIVGLRPLVTNY